MSLFDELAIWYQVWPSREVVTALARVKVASLYLLASAITAPFPPTLARPTLYCDHAG
ncbi:hypothetical protein [Lentilactobacillus curieae]|uniref:hypothetical protein n=1 Tax=Lentilactobacillus curieae TaxID=1138822 RepID=UPI001784C3C6|nr:hypothetical protein [Lentilactobacillus curieae]